MYKEEIPSQDNVSCVNPIRKESTPAAMIYDRAQIHDVDAQIFSVGVRGLLLNKRGGLARVIRS